MPIFSDDHGKKSNVRPKIRKLNDVFSVYKIHIRLLNLKNAIEKS